MIVLKEVKTRRDRKEFIEFPLRLYKNNPYFVPPLYGDEMSMFKKNYHYNEQSKSVFYLAYKDDRLVGRIQGILQFAANEKWRQKRVRFTRFDSIDDQDVADALFKAIEDWAKKEGMEEVVGPLGYSDLEREGLLIEGFDKLSTFEEQYNYEYYKKLIENCGYEKEIDWTERELRMPKEASDRLSRIGKLMLKKYDLHFVEFKTTGEFIKKYIDDFFYIIDETYDQIYGTVPLTEGTKKSLISSFKLIVAPKYVAMVVDKDNKPVGIGLCFPSIGEALQKSGGRLTPPAIIRLLKAIKHPKVLDLGLVGVIPEYRLKGVGSMLISGGLELLEKDGIDHLETNLNLENNDNIQNQWKNFDSVIHKRRRSFVKKI